MTERIGRPLPAELRTGSGKRPHVERTDPSHGGALFTTNGRLRGIVFTVNFVAVLLMWLRLVLAGGPASVA